MKILEVFESKIKQTIFDKISIKNINNLRKIKWSFLKHFINDNKTIKSFFHEEIEIKILEKLFPKILENNSPVVLDIGANIGAYSYYLSKFVMKYQGKCIGFEPRTDIWNRLKDNIKSTNFIAEKMALSDRRGAAYLFLPTSHGLSSLINNPEFEGFGSEKVLLTTLDSYISSESLNPIVFVKIDVEGHELEVLKGGNVTIQKYKPIILCESEDRHLIHQGRSIYELMNYVKDIGYKSFIVSKKRFDIIHVEEKEMREYQREKSEYYYNFWFICEKNESIVIKIQEILSDIKKEFTKRI